jgi:hypothetical protein
MKTKVSGLLKSSVINEAVEEITTRLSSLADEKITKLEKTATIDSDEFIAYQNLQSRMFASGTISKTDAMWLYNMLNGWLSQPLADRIVALELLSALIQIR